VTEGDERLDKVEQRLGTVETGLKEVREEVGGLREAVGGLREEVGGLRNEVGGLRGEVGGLRGEVNQLRILGEKNTEDIKKIAEVQAHHGRTLDEHSTKLDAIAKALTPLRDIHDFISRVAPDHELRIGALEKHTGIRD
jgi:archaellum component FlaC